MFPNREPPFHSDWWSIDRLAPILLILLLLAVVVWAVVRFTRQPRAVPAGGVDTGPGRSSPGVISDPAVEQVRQRYARGELDRDTFLQTVRDLSPGGVEAGATDEPPPSATP
jgi:uncharacterized membrane protein